MTILERPRRILAASMLLLDLGKFLNLSPNPFYSNIVWNFFRASPNFLSIASNCSKTVVAVSISSISSSGCPLLFSFYSLLSSTAVSGVSGSDSLSSSFTYSVSFSTISDCFSSSSLLFCFEYPFYFLGTRPLLSFSVASLAPRPFFFPFTFSVSYFSCCCFRSYPFLSFCFSCLSDAFFASI